MSELFRAADPEIVFVRVTRGIYIKTHVCITVVACSHCGADINEPCRGTSNNKTPISMTHSIRRRDRMALLRQQVAQMRT